MHSYYKQTINISNSCGLQLELVKPVISINIL